MPAWTDGPLPNGTDVVLLRHGETAYNARHLLNGDPAIGVALSERGRAECGALARRFAGTCFAAAYVTRFPRTLESLRILLTDPDAPEPAVIADLDDIDVGEFESRPRDEYRAWRRDHGVTEGPAGGESRLSVVHRYGRGLARLAAEAPTVSLVVTHDQPLRYFENVLLGEDPVFGPVGAIPNAVPYAYSRGQLTEAAGLLRAYSATQPPSPVRPAVA